MSVAPNPVAATPRADGIARSFSTSRYVVRLRASTYTVVSHRGAAARRCGRQLAEAEDEPMARPAPNPEGLPKMRIVPKPSRDDRSVASSRGRSIPENSEAGNVVPVPLRETTVLAQEARDPRSSREQGCGSGGSAGRPVRFDPSDHASSEPGEKWKR
jgi:hypothetical protein